MIDFMKTLLPILEMGRHVIFIGNVIDPNTFMPVGVLSIKNFDRMMFVQNDIP